MIGRIQRTFCEEFDIERSKHDKFIGPVSGNPRLKSNHISETELEKQFATASLQINP
jgi:hypothetical protein